MEKERVQILTMLEAGQIGAGEAAQLLAALEAGEPEVEGEAPATIQRRPSPASQRWAHFWIYPLLAGGLVLVVGAVILGLVASADTARGWLVCGWIPILLGLSIVVLAWWTRKARWLHLRISEGGKRKVAFSFPLPLGLAAWGLRLAQPFVPQLRESGVDDLIIALRDNVTQDEPLFVDVQDDEKGEHVQVYIG